MFKEMIQRGQNGFTFLELLMIIAILGLLAAIIIPNLTSFTTTGRLAAANNEVQNLRTAASGYRAHNTAWAADSAALSSYITGAPEGSYTFDTTTGLITGASGWDGLTFNVAPDHQLWERSP